MTAILRPVFSVGGVCRAVAYLQVSCDYQGTARQSNEGGSSTARRRTSLTLEGSSSVQDGSRRSRRVYLDEANQAVDSFTISLDEAGTADGASSPSRIIPARKYLNYRTPSQVTIRHRVGRRLESKEAIEELARAIADVAVGGDVDGLLNAWEGRRNRKNFNPLMQVGSIKGRGWKKGGGRGGGGGGR